jgi:hypothetical protein
MVGTGAFWFSMIPFALVFLLAFGLFAGVALLAKRDWGIGGSIGVVVAMVVLFLTTHRAGTGDLAASHILLPGLTIISLVIVRWMLLPGNGPKP